MTERPTYHQLGKPWHGPPPDRWTHHWEWEVYRLWVTQNSPATYRATQPHLRPSIRCALYNGHNTRFLVRYETELSDIAVRMCNRGDAYPDEWAWHEKRYAGLIRRNIGPIDGLFFEGDPRGPIIKVHPVFAGDLDRDPAGNGIVVQPYE